MTKTQFDMDIDQPEHASEKYRTKEETPIEGVMVKFTGLETWVEELGTNADESNTASGELVSESQESTVTIIIPQIPCQL